MRKVHILVRALFIVALLVGCGTSTHDHSKPNEREAPVPTPTPYPTIFYSDNADPALVDVVIVWADAIEAYSLPPLDKPIYARIDNGEWVTFTRGADQDIIYVSLSERAVRKLGAQVDLCWEAGSDLCAAQESLTLPHLR